MTFAELVPNVRDAVCQINVSGDSSQSGTGFATGQDGRIVTCAHVVKPNWNVSKIRAVFPSGHQCEATVRWIDTGKDLAVLQPDRPIPATLRIGSATSARVGDEVVIAGYPTGVSTLSFFRGSVSAKGSNLFPRISGELLQLAATVQRGNSGGPVFLADSATVIGIVSLKYVPLFTQVEKLRQVTENWPRQQPGVSWGNVDFPSMFNYIGQALNELSSALILVSVGVGWAIPIDQLDTSKL